MDYKALKTNYLLNKGFFFGQDLEVYKAFSDNDKEKNLMFTNPTTFLTQLVRLKRSERNEDFLISENTYLDFIDGINSDNNIVPIGVIQLEGEWLEGYEVDENVEAKKNNRPINKLYNKFNIYSASVLVEEVATPQVNFILDEFVYFDEKNKIKAIEIDFGDGEGYRAVNKGDQISIDYGFPGEKAIAIKMKTKKGEFYNYSTINIIAYEKLIPDEVIELRDTRRGSVTRDLSGGRAKLFVGCDGVLDKPVIFVEGWDALNERTFWHFQTKGIPLNTLESTFKNAGYDMIYLNYSDGGADIRTNSTVLQNLIKDINIRKIGNEKIVVIGASMGGLVARHAIRKLELANYTHHVSHYISYDSPHKGSNLPVGIQSAFLDADDIFIRDVFGIAESIFYNGKKMLNSKAARQMIMRYKGPNPHPDFTQFQNELNTLGFPSQGGIRNVAIVNADEDGVQQSPVNNLDPGDKIASANFAGRIPLIGFVNADADVWTNDINKWDKVSSIKIYVNAVPVTWKTKSYYFNGLDYDICAGGKLPFGVPSILSYYVLFGYNVNNHGRESLCHSPLFSTTASTETITTQSQLNRSIQSIKNNDFTPFDEIYAGSTHTSHTDSREIIPVWNDLLTNELNITPSTTGCLVQPGTMGQAPTPFINGHRFYMCEYDRRVQFWAENPSALDSFYNHNWTVTGPEPFLPRSGERYTMSYATPGYYTLRLTRSYVAPINGSTSATYSRVVRSYPYWHPYYGCEETGPIRSSHIPEVPEQESILKVFPNPNAGNILNVTFELSQEEEIDLSIQSIDGRLSSRKTLLEGKRVKGKYSETFDISYLSTGVYIVLLNTPSQQNQQKIIIQK